MTIARKQTEHLIKATALGIIASSTLFGQSTEEISQTPNTSPPVPAIIASTSKTPLPDADAKPSAPRSEFTGKVQVHCAPLRSAPQSEAISVIEVERATLLRVTGKEGDFYQVLPPEGLKAYIASRYVSDKSVLGEHVNIRSRPNTESAILGQVNTGATVDAEPLTKAPDWMAMPFPDDRKLYIRADLIKRVGGDDTYEVLQQKRAEILRALTEAQTLNAEAQRQLVEDSPTPISWNDVRAAYEKVCTLASRSSAFTELAQSAESQLQEAFLKYQTSFSQTEQVKRAQLEPSAQPPDEGTSDKNPISSTAEANAWAKIEQQNLQDWLHANPEKNQEHYALNQEELSQVIEGNAIAFERLDLRQKPGDFILMRRDLPVAYLYSATIDLEKLKGKTLKFQVVKRNDLGFALPAYCVLSIKD